MGGHNNGMNRRSFISSLLAGSIAPMFLPGAGRIWKMRENLTVPIRLGWYDVSDFQPGSWEKFMRDWRAAVVVEEESIYRMFTRTSKDIFYMKK